MPQNIMTKQLALEGTDAIAKEPTSVDSYAERLMDELFEDVDRALEGSAGLPTEPVQPEFVSLKPIAVPQIILPTPTAHQEDRLDAEAIARQAILATQKQQAKQSFDRMLLGAAFASLLLVLGLWLASRTGPRRAVVSAPAVSASESAIAAKAEADAQFGTYMQQALDTLDQKKAAPAKQQNPNLPGVPTTTNLPAIPVPGGPPPTAGLAQAINRVADAIQQVGAQPGTPPTQVVIVPPAAAKAGSPAAKTGSPAASPANVAAAPKTPSSPAVAPQVAPSPGRILAREPEPAPAPAPASEAATAPSPAASAPVTPSPTSETATAAHTLVGILELGARSAALFEIDGVARRIYVGESIGASGWTLAEVKNQEAVIRKGGEVRSIFVGQKF
ncbi:MAG TPA: hypothetical protein VK211_20080 [Kamptonema sp.]|nr:hypothetical protein [Kamptonema sp.]